MTEFPSMDVPVMLGLAFPNLEKLSLEQGPNKVLQTHLQLVCFPRWQGQPEGRDGKCRRSCSAQQISLPTTSNDMFLY